MGLAVVKGECTHEVLINELACLENVWKQQDSGKISAVQGCESVREFACVLDRQSVSA